MARRRATVKNPDPFVKTASGVASGSRDPLTSQTRAAVVVLPTPGGPESRAALYPEPSSFPPPNLPNLAAAGGGEGRGGWG